MKLKSFIGTTVRFHVPITYSYWPTVPEEIKDKIFELVEKYRLTTTYVLPFLDDLEKLKFSRNEYSFIEQQHWIEFVASRLKEDFKKNSENGKEKRKQHKYNHRTSRKGYANFMEELDELVATQKTTNAFGEEDIITRTLDGKDHPGIVNIAKDDEQMEGVILEKMKASESKLAFEMKDHVVAWRTIFDLDIEGDNVKVAADVMVVGDFSIFIPLKQEMYKMSHEVGSHILWSQHLVTIDNIKMDYEEFTKDMTIFAPTPIQNASVALRFLLRMDFSSMRPIATACLDVYIMYLYTDMESSRTLNLYKFVDAGLISYGSSKEECAQLLIARLLGTDYDQLLLIHYNFGYFDKLE
ncbi:uncharacterized protein E5676_scaffold1567G00520 [Cucumis melo var. makuwa]|uniref:Serine/threonine-protein kinase nek2 n=1 Tax=Cucumis melo var. makuwa TaxID=1194695 RepID=A0A5D3DQU6_CUCMM|nr:uncharacterized protein E6C27_scaffold38G002720 [Cucumis melo var. makuwa]TYK26036.1 uncharacterized protein E5676_scaffold1567G00520 [Cucumis melo var. makuwa]